MAWTNFVEDLSEVIFCGQDRKSTGRNTNVKSQQIQLSLTAVQHSANVNNPAVQINSNTLPSFSWIPSVITNFCACTRKLHYFLSPYSHFNFIFHFKPLEIVSFTIMYCFLKNPLESSYLPLTVKCLRNWPSVLPGRCLLPSVSDVFRFASNSGLCFYTSYAFLVAIVFFKTSRPFMSSLLVLLERKTFSVKLKCCVTTVPYIATAANVNKENI